MNTPEAPAAPDPVATANAQTNSNVNTAIANTIMGNANETSNLGSVKYNQIGSQQIKDASGNMIDVPQYERITSLSPEQQHLYDQQTQLGSSMNDLAQSQVGRLSDTLGKPLSLDGLPAAANSAQRPDLATSYANGGSIQQNVQLDKASTDFADVGGPQRSLGDTNYSYDAARASDALMNRMQPQIEQDRAALQSRLANQGITPGSEAWRNAMDQQGRGVNDARLGAVMQGYGVANQLFGQNLQAGQFTNSAQQQAYDQARNRGLYGLQATQQNNAAALDAGTFANSAQAQGTSQNAAQAAFGNQAQQQNYSNAQDAANFQNTLRQNAMQEQLALRNQPINEISALMNGGQVTMPQFQAYKPGTVDQTPIGQNIYDSANINSNNWRTQQAASASTLGGLFGLGGSIAGAAGKAGSIASLFAMSDIRLKRDIVRIGTGSIGVPLYSFRYLWDDAPQVGYMAQEVAEVMPDAVAVMPNGFLAVDYAKAVI